MATCRNPSREWWKDLSAPAKAPTPFWADAFPTTKGMQPYRFSFVPSPGSRKRHVWIRYGKGMEATFERAKKAARAEYPEASGWMIESPQRENPSLRRRNPGDGLTVWIKARGYWVGGRLRPGETPQELRHRLGHNQTHVICSMPAGFTPSEWSAAILRGEIVRDNPSPKRRNPPRDPKFHGVFIEPPTGAACGDSAVIPSKHKAGKWEALVFDGDTATGRYTEHWFYVRDYATKDAAEAAARDLVR